MATDRELAAARAAHRRFVAADQRARTASAERRAAILAAIAAGATQRDVARALDLDPATVNRIIRGAGPRRRA